METTIQKEPLIDDVITEIHRIKDQVAADCQSDVRKLAEALRKAQGEESRKVVDLSSPKND